MSFNLQQLMLFTTIVSAGSLGRAATMLNMTQPALSRSIKPLEESVGAPLFERHKKGMHLTALGEALMPHAVSLQREAERAREELDAMRGLTKGVIKVGAVSSIASLVLPMSVACVLEKWPKLRVEVIEGVWDRLVEGLLSHEIDLALCTSGIETENVAAISDCLWTDRSYVVAATDHPLRAKGKLRLDDTLTQLWALTPKGTEPYVLAAQISSACTGPSRFGSPARHGIALPARRRRSAFGANPGGQTMMTGLPRPFQN